VRPGSATGASARIPDKPPPAAGRPALRRLRRTLGETAALARTVPTGRWLAVIALAAVNWLTDLACLLAAVHAVGLSVSAGTVATAYLAAQLIRQIPATPGGIGVIEAGLILALTTAGAAAAPAAAAVLIYRLLSCWMVLPIGLICWTAQNPAAAPAARQGLPTGHA
jgi:putative heme transporter